MFTGIVQGLGKVRSHAAGVLILDVDPSSFGEPWVIGESIAVNGCCLTVVEFAEGLRFELSPETLSRTALGSLRGGELVNLERALRPTDRLGGHFVQGHVDAVGSIESIRQEGNSWVFAFAGPREYGRYIIDKGSVCVDGISLTAVAPENGRFEVWVIPHTKEHTNLRGAVVGRRVNLEYDMLAKYVEGLLRNRENAT